MKELFPFIGFEEGKLKVEGVFVEEVARKVGTPVYIYSKRAIEEAFKEFNFTYLTAFAVKSNSNVSILRLLKDLGAGADTVSIGEIFRALTAGIEPKKIVFAGVGKREEEIEFALERGILMFNVESKGELLKIEEVAKKLNKRAPVAVRVNPEVDPKTHPYIATGLKNSKFGVDFESALELYKIAKESKYLEPIGIHFHIGSQIKELSAFKEASLKVRDFVKELRSERVEIELFDAGGGIGTNYEPFKEPPSVRKLSEILKPIVKELGLKLILEPGRRIVGNAGVLITQVLYVKRNKEKTFYIVDAGMNDLARPSLYKAYHYIDGTTYKEKRVKATVVGPICESGDVFAEDRELPKLKEGDYLAIFSTGAYGFSMASNYNSRPRPAEVLIDGDSYKVIRERETLASLIEREF